MKTSSAPKNKSLDREAAFALAGINQFATPGLGTLLSGRIIAGLVQLAFATAGFLLILYWFFTLFRGLIAGSAAGANSIWQWGALLFATGWLLALFSSLQIIRHAPAKKPPRLDGSPG